MHGAGMATWTIAKRTNTTAHDVERVIARSKLAGDGEGWASDSQVR